MESINSSSIAADGHVPLYHICQPLPLPPLPTGPSRRYDLIELRRHPSDLEAAYAQTKIAQESQSSPLNIRRQQTTNMCFFECYKFSCRDWKWGNFKQHCNREYRTGETCGMKMIFCTIDLPDKCAFCEKIEKKLRRREKAMSDRARWLQEPHRFKASIEKAAEDIRTLEREITSIQAEKDRRYQNVGNTKRSG